MERLQPDAEEHHVLFDLTNIFNESEITFEQIDTSDIPDNVLSDILNQAEREEQQKVNQSEAAISIARSNTLLDTPKQKISNRFKVVTQDDVDQIAGKSCKKRTHKQTEWGIKVFRGNILIVLFIPSQKLR